MTRRASLVPVLFAGLIIVLAASRANGATSTMAHPKEKTVPHVIADGRARSIIHRLRLPRHQPCAACWHPPLHTTWQWQLDGRLDMGIRAKLYDVDAFDTTAAQVLRLHRLGRRVVCYIDAGTWEQWRADAARFPKRILGQRVSGWPGERWLDIRRISVLAPIMHHRVEVCRRKGFNGVEFDNVDGYQNRSGFSISAADQLRYNVFLSGMAHRAGLSVGLKNDTDQVSRLVSYFDWALDEQCFQYRECTKLLPFIRAGKPVFEVEYFLPRSRFCASARALGFNSMRKHLSLGPWLARC